jgi:hypothetical protein
MYDRFLRLTKNLLGIIALFYFFAPILFRFLIKKSPTMNAPSSVEKFFASPIFHPVLEQYDIALAKNSPIYYLAFYVCMMLACLACWLIAFYVVKLIYLLIKKIIGK